VEVNFFLYQQGAARKPSELLESADYLKFNLILESLAERELPNYMGRKYTDIVLSCLRISGARINAGQRFEASNWADIEGVEIGLSYIENVLERMHEISM